MEVHLRPKHIIVLGGASGIGFSTAQKLLDAGAKSVLLASRNYDKLEAACLRLRHDGTQRAEVLSFDIAAVATHHDFIREVETKLGVVPDGLVISSGVDFDGSNWKGFNISEADWDRVMNINLKGVFFLIRNFANYLQERKTPGNICVVSSISAHRDMLSVYQISKNAISGIVHAYGKHLCERGVVLNCVEPGTTNTDMMRWLAEYTDGKRPGKPWNDNSIRRLIRPEEIADIICFLMSDRGEIMSGSCVLASGGCKSISR